MMAASRKMLDQEPSDIEMLLPFHAAGTLSARDARRVEDALASDPELARQYAVIREEYAETISLNESLGAPSARAMAKLFAAIDEEPVRKPSLSVSLSARISEFFARLSPRTLAWSASLGAVALLLQAGVIGAVLMKNQTASFQTASLSLNEQTAAPITPACNSSATAPRLADQASVRGDSLAKNSDIRVVRLTESDGLRTGSPSIAANSFVMAREDGAPRLSLRLIVSAYSSRMTANCRASPGSLASASSTRRASRALKVPAAWNGNSISISLGS